MTCPCKAELAAMLLEVLEVGRASSYGVDRERFDHAQPFRDMKDAVMRRLSPAPAEPQEPLTGWRADAEVLAVRGGVRVEWWNGRGAWWIDRESGRFLLCTDRPGSEWAAFPTASAARAALLAASEPGKPAPAPFDAAKWAEKMVQPCNHHDEDRLDFVNIDGTNAACLAPLSWAGRDDVVKECRASIAAALTAAHEAGKAEAGQPRPRRWPDRWGMHDDRVLRWNEKHAVWLSCQTAHLADGDIYLPKPPAPPAEKEGPR